MEKVDKNSAAYVLNDVYMKFLDKFINVSVAHKEYLQLRKDYLKSSADSFKNASDAYLKYAAEGFVGDLPKIEGNPDIDRLISILDVQSSSYAVYMHSLFDSFMYSVLRILALSVPEKFNFSDDSAAFNLENLLSYESREEIIKDYVNSRIRSLNNRNLSKKIEFIEKKILQTKLKEPLLDPLCEKVFNSASIQRNALVHNLLGVDIELDNKNRLRIGRKDLGTSEISPQNIHSALSFSIQLQVSKLIRIIYEKILHFNAPPDMRESLRKSENFARSELLKLL
ncbi:hypothetical protein [Azospirillum sp.]|uniref:hypothetical protein n=1 Tax=Azospirillum sp. TaxID=34012 RepID=UPI002605D40E|nr:hypothetical protein [Azospirillum sp.]